MRDHTTAESEVTSPLAIPDGSAGRVRRTTLGAAAADTLGTAAVALAAAVAASNWRRLKFMLPKVLLPGDEPVTAGRTA
ncbi:hypothetical protein GCM10009789_76010 [Kribbella sancticallisti]|uniref:Uncharacterized protein n=1 Tax=Kribbella sancticallisti TaxID=460087 RepID=A0ABP4QLF6_9ACTN